MNIPSIYLDGYARACAVNRDIATRYVENTVVDDPLADGAFMALLHLDGKKINQIMNACTNLDAKLHPETPQALIDFIEAYKTPPPWLDGDALLPGRIAFHRYLDLFIIGFIIASLRNFNSLMSKVFFLTGQATTEQGLMVIRQNIRYLCETLMLPSALNPGQQGWKFSLRIRLVHARIRNRLRNSDHWDEAALGVPISAANMGLTSANFSALLIRDVERLGARLNADERLSIMRIWRYASWLIGTPETLLCDGDESATAELSKIGHLCEPKPDRITAIITNATVQALPQLAKLTDPKEKQAMASHAYGVARSLLGEALADQYGFPKHRGFEGLPRLRFRCRIQKACRKLLPRSKEWFRKDPFELLLDAAMIDDLLDRGPEELKAGSAGIGRVERMRGSQE
ncbi:MAG: oxygenase MpaB family protein [Gammaproteobacteria bacterium]|nr:oxygenase MpaB family protein [Gammaproteobacteria bacterium]